MNSFWGDTSWPVAIAHRGGAGLYEWDRHRHENTLKVFKSSVKMGYEYLELDVTDTADGKVIVLHVTADTFEKMLRKKSAPNAEKFQKLSYQQIKKQLGREIPILEDVINAFPKTKFLVDAKTDEVVEMLAAVVRKTKSIDRVFVNSFYLERVMALQKLLGKKLNCGVVIGRHPRYTNSRLRAFKQGKYFGKGFSAVTVPRRYLTRQIVELAHKNGLKVLVWAPNTDSQIHAAIRRGVDGIITDNVKLLKETLSS